MMTNIAESAGRFFKKWGELAPTLGAMQDHFAKKIGVNNDNKHQPDFLNSNDSLSNNLTMMGSMGGKGRGGMLGMAGAIFAETAISLLTACGDDTTTNPDVEKNGSRNTGGIEISFIGDEFSFDPDKEPSESYLEVCDRVLNLASEHDEFADLCLGSMSRDVTEYELSTHVPQDEETLDNLINSLTCLYKGSYKFKFLEKRTLSCEFGETDDVYFSIQSYGIIGICDFTGAYSCELYWPADPDDEVNYPENLSEIKEEYKTQCEEVLPDLISNQDGIENCIGNASYDYSIRGLHTPSKAPDIQELIDNKECLYRGYYNFTCMSNEVTDCEIGAEYYCDYRGGDKFLSIKIMEDNAYMCSFKGEDVCTSE